MFGVLSFRWIDSFALMIPVMLGLAVAKLQPSTDAWILGGAIREKQFTTTSPSVLTSFLRKSLSFLAELVRSADFPVANRRDHQRWAQMEV